MYYDLHTWGGALRVHTPSPRHVWVNHQYLEEKFASYLLDIEADSTTLVAGLDQRMDGVQIFGAQQGQLHAVLLNCDDPYDRECRWRHGIKAGAEGQQRILLLAEHEGLKTESALVVDEARDDSGFQHGLLKVGETLFYAVSLFERHWEMRSFNPCTGRREIRECDWTIPAPILVDGLPYVVRDLPDQFRLMEYFGDREIDLPKEWGEPFRVAEGLVLAANGLTQSDPIHAYDLQTGRLVQQGRGVLFSNDGEPILFV